MIRDGRLSDVLHVLLHMAAEDGPSTSEALARALQTNPVVIRRTLAGLRDANIVVSEKGHGGGWTIKPDLASVTLRDVYVGLGSPTLFAIGNRNEDPDCVVEQAVNAALRDAFSAAEKLLLDRFGTITLAELSANFRMRIVAGGRSFDLETVHAV